MHKGKHILWGITFILLAVLMSLNILGYTVDVSAVSIVISVLLLPIIITSIPRLNFMGIFVPLSIIVGLFSEQLGIKNVGFFQLIIIGVFLGMGFSFLFHGRRKRRMFCHCDGVESVLNDEDDTVNIDCSFKGVTMYVNSKNLKTANIESNFGGVKLFFDNANISEESADFNFELNFSGVELFIPNSWKVVDETNCMASGIKTNGSPKSDANRTIVLKGDLNLSGITINYI